MDATFSRRFFMVLAVVLLSGRQSSPELQPAAAGNAAAGDAAVMRGLSKALSADKALGWSDAVDPCKWNGIECSNGQITRIQIGNHSLTGTLPPDLGKLTALNVLELQYNSVTGPLPSLAGLSSLQRILLDKNNFTSIPADFFSGLSGLQDVSLDDNPFEPWRIPDDLKDLNSLNSFSANSANIRGPIPDFLGSIVGVKHIGLAYNLLDGGIPSSFSGSTVQTLWINGQRSSNGLTGSIRVLANMTSLVQLWLNMNQLTGPLPDFSGLTNLQELNLRDNQLTGIVPKSLISLKSLTKVVLTNNLLQGPVPTFQDNVTVDLDPSSERFCHSDSSDCDPRVDVLLSIAKSFGYPRILAESWQYNDPCSGWSWISCRGGNITVVNLVNLGLNGTISPDFALLPFLQKLFLFNNNLTGSIPSELVNLKSLLVLDVSNNSLDGIVPNFSKNISVITTGNPNISTGRGNGSATPDDTKNIGKSSHTKLVIGCVIGGICVAILGCLLFFCYRKKVQELFGKHHTQNVMVIHPQHSGSASDQEMLKISLAANLDGGVRYGSETHSLSGSGPSDVDVVESQNLVISIQILRKATDNFSEGSILGRGGFGIVYEGKLDDGTMIAVKRMMSGVMGSQGLDEFKSEIAVLTKVRHRHLVSLLGYCLDANEKILVYEYMPQGTLSDHLFHWMQAGRKPLEWTRRLSIALDVARGVEYLHGLAQQSFIHRDLKPSNILLGNDMKAKVADFGLVRLAPEGKYCSVQTRLAGTFGYLAPEYAERGRVGTKSDVYSFGVVLMELITGRKAIDESLPEESKHLVTCFRRMLINKVEFQAAIDRTIQLDDDETLGSIGTVAELARHCCARESHQRPDMSHAVNVLSSLAESWNPDDIGVDESYDINDAMSLPLAIKRWQELGDDSQFDGTTSSFKGRDSSQCSIPTRPSGFAESFASADAR